MPHRKELTTEQLAECAAVRDLYLRDKQKSKTTYGDLGNAIGKSDKTVAAICRGEMRVTLDVGRKLAKYFGVPLVEILPWTVTLALDGPFADVIDDFQDLNEENQAQVRRVLRSLLESQES